MVLPTPFSPRSPYIPLPISKDISLKIGWLELGKYKYYADPNDGGAFASNKTLIIDGVSYTFDYGGTLINNVP